MELVCRREAAPVKPCVVASGQTERLTKQRHEAHIRAVVSPRIDAVPPGTRKTPPVWRTPEEMYPLVRELFVRELIAAVAACSWYEMVKDLRELTGRVSAAAASEMDGLGLTTRSFHIKAIDFPEGSEPTLALRRAAAEVAARRASVAKPGEV
jgi:hypothetical protein